MQVSQSDSHLHGYTLTLARGFPLTPCIPPEKEKTFSFSAGENNRRRKKEMLLKLIIVIWKPIYIIAFKILGGHWIIFQEYIHKNYAAGTAIYNLGNWIFLIGWFGGRIKTFKDFKKKGKAYFSQATGNTLNKFSFKNIDNTMITADKGIFFGKIQNKNIIKPQAEDGHVLVVGGQGSGKTTSIAIPTLLTWTAGVFAIDIKGDLSNIVSKNRDNIKIFDPMDPNTCTYNPYDIFKNNSNRVQSAKEIAISIMPVPKDIKDPFWKQSAQNLLIASILHFELLGYDFPDTMNMIMKFSPSQLIEELKNSKEKNVPLFANQFVDSDVKVLGGIFTELSNSILLFATDDNIKNCLTSSMKDINIRDLEDGSDIFIRLQEDKLEQWKQVINLIVSQFLRAFERRQDNNKKPILFLLDEFPRLGRIDGITNGLSTLRSKNIHILLIIQSLAQLDDIYSKEKRKIIADNCRYKAILNAFDSDTQDYFSRLVGTYDMVKESSSKNFDFVGFKHGTGKTKTTEERKIIKPEEFAYLHDTLVLFTPKGFETPDKIPYFKDKYFLNLLETETKITERRD